MIRFPANLVEMINKNVETSKRFKASKLRENYEQNKDHEQLHSTYLMSRMPATYAAITRVLEEISTNTQIATALDIGSGPGTGLWALREKFPSMAAYIGLEADGTFIELAKHLNSKALQPEVQWVQGRYPQELPKFKADLVLMSYTVGENSSETLMKTIERVWDRNVSEWLVVIEPGTPKGYKSILDIRGYIAENGGYIYAPCKGNYSCPLVEQDWCHFSVRLERTLLQKKIKDATLPYEDEKFSYLIARKTPIIFDEKDARVIKKPVIRSGHVTLDLCSNGVDERTTVSKSQKEIYQKAKKSEWGDSWNKK